MIQNERTASPAAPTRIIRLARLIYEAAQARVYAGLAGEGFPEIRPAHSVIFRNIAPEGSRASDLAQRAGITKQSVSYLIETLEADGFAETIPDPTDGRARLVRLTRRGNAALATLNRLSDAVEAECIEGLPESRIRALRADLEQIMVAMQR
jgi:DNA-binding MarR family transcriptional regulator